MTAITAITAQNTVAVTAVHPLPGELIVEQVRAVADDIGVDAVKIGMLGTVETIEAVSGALDLIPGAPVVLDPVMVAESGARLLDEDAQEALRTLLLPRAAVVTPNVPEARALAAAGPDAEADELARAVHALGPAAVVVTGGHREQAVDVFFDGDSWWRSRESATWTAPRTGPAARTPRPWRRTWRWASSRSKRRAPRSGSRQRP